MEKKYGALWQASGASIASAAIVNLALATGNSLHITGSTGPITSFGTVDEGVIFTLIFDSTPTITHHATSLILPGSANIVAAAGDTMILRSEGSGNWRCISYVPKTGLPVVAPTITTLNPNVLNRNFTLFETMSALDVVYQNDDGVISTFDGLRVSGSTAFTNTGYAESIMLNSTTILTAYYTASTLKLRAGTISGDTITYGAEINTGYSAGSLAHDYKITQIDTLSGVLAVRESSTVHRGVPFTVSGTTITLGSAVTINNTALACNVISVCKIDTNKVAFLYDCGASSNRLLNIRVGTVSSNVLTLGSEDSNIGGGGTINGGLQIIAVSTSKVIFGVKLTTGGYVRAGTVSGTTITLGTAISGITFDSSADVSLIYSGVTDKVLWTYESASVVVSSEILSLSGTTITRGGLTTNAIALEGAKLFQYNSNTFGIVSTNSGSYYVTFLTIDPANSSTIVTIENIMYGVGSGYRGTPVQYISGKFIIPELSVANIYIMNNGQKYLQGVLQESGVAAQSKKVSLTGSISVGHSGLIPGFDYYLKPAGGLTIDSSGQFTAINTAGASANISRKIGRAVSATELLVNIT